MKAQADAASAVSIRFLGLIPSPIKVSSTRWRTWSSVDSAIRVSSAMSRALITSASASRWFAGTTQTIGMRCRDFDVHQRVAAEMREHGDIELAGGDQVQKLRRGPGLHGYRNIRILGDEFCDQTLDQAPGERRHGADREPPEAAFADIVGLFRQGLDADQCTLHVLIEQLAFRRRQQPAGTAVEQGKSDPPFQRRDQLADGRLRDVQPLPGDGHGAAFEHRLEGFDLPEVQMTWGFFQHEFWL